MANQLYQTQLSVEGVSTRATQTFYWIANNLTDEHPYEVARDIGRNISNDTLWLYKYLGLLTNHCVVSHLITRRFDPQHANAAESIRSFDKPQGRVEGRIDFDFVCVTIQWHTTDDRTGKLQSRIGPVSAGSCQIDGWFPIFAVRCRDWALEHRTPRTTLSGVDFQAACRSNDGTASAIIADTLRWPPSRQKNRRAEK